MVREQAPFVKKGDDSRELALARAQSWLLQQAVEAFQASTGLELQLRPAPPGLGQAGGWHLILTPEEGGLPRVYRALVRSIERAEALGTVKAELQQCPEPGLLVLSRASGPIAQQCRAMGIPFIDGEGNAYLKDRGLQIFVTGQKRRQGQEITGTGLPTGRASTPIGLKLVFALLSNPALTMATTQMLQEATGVSMGTVPAVLGDLEQQGQLVRLGWGKGWQVRNWRQLLDEWALHYAVRLRPRLHSYRFRSPGQGLWWKGLDPQVFGGQWGGEVAAAQLGTVLKPEKAILYLQQGDMRLGLSQLIKSQALRSDPDGDVEVVEAFWENERLGWSGCCVPLPLVIADLQASQDARNIEAAVELKESWLRDVEA